MGYLGLTPTTAQQNYLNIDDISGSFDGSTTSFALLTGGVAPSPFPVTNSCLISVGGVIQEPDDTGTSGFRISGSNIVFSSAPGTGEDFFGLILAGADYLNIGANFPVGAVGTPSITFDGDTNTGIYHPSADELSFVTGGSDRVRVDSNGRLGIGTVSPSRTLDVTGTARVSSVLTMGSYIQGTTQLDLYGDSSSSKGVRLESSGNVGIGTTSPGSKLELSASSNACELRLRSTDTTNAIIRSYVDSQEAGKIAFTSGRELFIETAGTERARIDSSGRLLVGTTSSATTGNAQYSTLQVQGNSSGNTGAILALQRGQGASSIVDGSTLGVVDFTDNTGNSFTRILASGDGTAGTNDYPGRLTFWTTADGASSPTERMRIRADGIVLIAKTSAGDTVTGVQIGTDGRTSICRDSAQPLTVSRNGTDGTLIQFLAQGTEEGQITVSGTTVSYNGAHLSRWSQLPGGVKRTEILRGSVLSNIDEMCEWGEEENEQLNRMKVSDVEGDKNVSGVFQAWDDDDDTYTNDFYCAMTGDFIIRIAADVTVERGDLLMSAGDGTAKPQDDDIIRSKTIAKVTSTNVSCTYDDGSYCVPCVLMAC